MIDVEGWAEIRRMHRVERLSIREIHRRSGLHRETIRRALAEDQPPRYRRKAAPSKLDPFKEEIECLLRSNPRITKHPHPRADRRSLAIRAQSRSSTIYLRELRPILCPKRTYQRTVYRPGELAQFDLIEPRRKIPVGHGQTDAPGLRDLRAGLVSRRRRRPRSSQSGFEDTRLRHEATASRHSAPCPRRSSGTARERSHDGHGNASEAFAAFCGALALGWSDPARQRDPESKGALGAHPPLHAHEL